MRRDSSSDLLYNEKEMDGVANILLERRLSQASSQKYDPVDDTRSCWTPVPEKLVTLTKSHVPLYRFRLPTLRTNGQSV